MNDLSRKARAQRGARVTARIERALHGLPSEEQGLILGHLLSLWIAGHFDKSEINTPNRRKTTLLRDRLLLNHMRIVREIIPEAEIRLLHKLALCAADQAD